MTLSGPSRYPRGWGAARKEGHNEPSSWHRLYLRGNDAGMDWRRPIHANSACSLWKSRSREPSAFPGSQSGRLGQEALPAPSGHRIARVRRPIACSNRSSSELIKVAESSQVNEMLAERAGLLDEAARIVATASAEGRELTEAEDSHVLELMKRAQTLDEEVAHLRRHHGGDRSERCRNQ
jgi:hypothetical protein